MTTVEKLKMLVRSNIAFHNARELDTEIDLYKRDPEGYKKEHPNFNIKDAEEKCQEYMDAFEEGFYKLQEDE